MSERIYRTLPADVQEIIVDGGKAAQEGVLQYQISEAKDALITRRV